MRILYVCTGNTFRSPMAEALTRKYHPDFEVESAGMHIKPEIVDLTKELMEEAGAREFLKPRTDQLTQRALDEADLVVAMMPRHAEFIRSNFHDGNYELIVWNVVDAIEGRKPKEVFSEIDDNVRRLVP